MTLELDPYQVQARQVDSRMFMKKDHAAAIRSIGAGKSCTTLHFIEQHQKVAFLLLALTEYILYTHTESPHRSNVERPLDNVSLPYIRYLDHQRSATEELPDNCMAVELNLGDVIVQGLLSVLKCVPMACQHQKSLAQYEKWVTPLRNQRNRERREHYRQMLYRILEHTKSDNLKRMLCANMFNESVYVGG